MAGRRHQPDFVDQVAVLRGVHRLQINVLQRVVAAIRQAAHLVAACASRGGGQGGPARPVTAGGATPGGATNVQAQAGGALLAVLHVQRMPCTGHQGTWGTAHQTAWLPRPSVRTIRKWCRSCSVSLSRSLRGRRVDMGCSRRPCSLVPGATGAGGRRQPAGGGGTHELRAMRLVGSRYSSRCRLCEPKSVLARPRAVTPAQAEWGPTARAGVARLQLCARLSMRPRLSARGQCQSRAASMQSGTLHVATRRLGMPAQRYHQTT